MSDRRHIPYRITIELAVGEKGKTIQLTGETPDVGDGKMTDANLCAIAANALAWESHAVATNAGYLAEWDRKRRIMNLPAPQWVM